MNNNEWDIAVKKIMKAINELNMGDTKEEMIKISIQYMILKMCESEEIFNDNMRILNQYAENGIVKKKTMGR